jgi:hypothetical protein
VPNEEDRVTVNTRTNRSSKSRLANSMAAIAAVMADCHHANRRLIELKLSGPRKS